MNKIEILVVEHEGEILFKTGDLFFDQLSAEREFERGNLSIKRDGKVLDKTEEIDEYGTHAATTCFMGLRRFFPEDSPASYAVASLVPDQFQVGDVLILEIHQKGDYAQHLRVIAAHHLAILEILEENPDGITMGELGKELPSRVFEKGDLTEQPEVIRFRRPSQILEGEDRDA